MMPLGQSVTGTAPEQGHDVDAGDNVILRRQLKRRYVLAFFPFD
jgi:hypothetical protein